MFQCVNINHILFNIYYRSPPQCSRWIPSSCVLCTYRLYMSFYICLCSVSPPPPPQPLQRSLTHMDHVKRKWQRCFMSLYPRSPFLFYWPQTPGFSEAKNRVLQTLTHPPSLLPPHLFPFSPSWFTGFYYGVFLHSAHSLLPFARQSTTSPFSLVHLRKRDVRVD